MDTNNSNTPKHLVVLGMEAAPDVHALIKEVVRQAAERGLQLVVHMPDALPTRPARRKTLIAEDGSSPQAIALRTELLTELAKKIDDWPEPVCWQERESSSEPRPELVRVKSVAKVRTHFQQFQHNVHNARPSGRRQHAFIRPPRRGGRS